jgi:hypothetical protein
MPALFKPLLVSLLLAVLIVTAGCDVRIWGPPAAVCVAEVAVLVGAGVLAPGPGEGVDLTLAATVFGACASAAALLFSDLVQDNSQQIEVFQPQQVTSQLKTTDPLTIPNCTGGATSTANYVIGVGIPIFLQVGTEHFDRRPDDTATDHESLIARGLIDRLKIPAGQQKNGYASFSLSVPPGKKAQVQLTGTVTSQTGTADIKQGSTVLVPLIAWRYPTGLSFPSGAAHTTLEDC